MPAGYLRQQATGVRRQATGATDALREEFEPLLISPYGLHFNRDLCRKAWDREEEGVKSWPEREETLQGEIAKADEWFDEPPAILTPLYFPKYFCRIEK